MFTARVPVIGLVEWSAAEVAEYARELARTHRSERISIQWRRWWVFGWPVLVEQACKRCGEPWPCPPAWWADRYQDSTALQLVDELR